MRLLIFFVVVGLVSLLVCWLPVWDSSDPAPDAEAREASTPAANDRLAADPTPRRSGYQDHDHSGREELPSNAPPGPGPDQVLLRGTISVRGPDKREHLTEDGKFVLKAWAPFGKRAFSTIGDDIQVTVEAGHWEACVPKKTNYFSTESVDLGGRMVVIDENEFPIPTPLPSDHHFELSGLWVTGARLRVVDAETSADLQSVIVVHARGWPRREFVHPGVFEAEDVVLKNGTSPFALSPKTSHGVSLQATYWVRARRYAWSRIKLFHTESGERELRLQKAGKLTVRVVGKRVPPGAVLRLFRVASGVPDVKLSGQPLVEVDVAQAGRYALDGLVPGTHQVQLAKGYWFQDPTIYATTKATVKVGESTEAELAVGEWKAPPSVEVAGTLYLPAEWKVTKPRLEFDPIGDLRHWVDHDPELHLGPAHRMSTEGDYRWRVGKLPAGSYQVIVHPIDVRVRIDIGIGGDTNVRIVAPYPAEVEVEVVDSETHAVLPKADLSWHTPMPEGVSGLSPREAKWDANKKLYRWRAPVGKIDISVHPEGYLWINRSMTLHRGLNRLQIPVGRVCGVHVTLVCNGTRVPWDDDLRASLSGEGHDGKEAYWSGHRVAVTKPGHYVLSLSSMKGFKKVKPRTVVVEKGKWKKVIVELERQQ